MKSSVQGTSPNPPVNVTLLQNDGDPGTSFNVPLVHIGTFEKLKSTLKEVSVSQITKTNRDY